MIFTGKSHKIGEVMTDRLLWTDGPGAGAWYNNLLGCYDNIMARHKVNMIDT